MCVIEQKTLYSCTVRGTTSLLSSGSSWLASRSASETRRQKRRAPWQVSAAIAISSPSTSAATTPIRISPVQSPSTTSTKAAAARTKPCAWCRSALGAGSAARGGGETGALEVAATEGEGGEAAQHARRAGSGRIATGTRPLASKLSSVPLDTSECHSQVSDRVSEWHSESSTEVLPAAGLCKVLLSLGGAESGFFGRAAIAALEATGETRRVGVGFGRGLGLVGTSGLRREGGRAAGQLGDAGRASRLKLDALEAREEPRPWAAMYVPSDRARRRVGFAAT